jgi:nitroimidazol reductase NimA-like FMN-containing flavoprotein (pyridoxamine 5'-phosphate oxidase superfamily)
MEYTPTDRTRVRRVPGRANYDRAFVHSVIDEALTCSVGFAVDGKPWVIPTIHTRIGETLYLHGAPANHMLKSLAGGIETCVSITLVDGLVLARSAFKHSMNYRSVVMFGLATRVEEGTEKEAALVALVEHVVRGRGADARPPTANELRSTLVLRLPIEEVSAKVRSGGPLDNEEDLNLDVWAGVLPCTTTYGAPLAEPGVARPAPAYLSDYTR